MYCNHINDPEHYMLSDNTCANCGAYYDQTDDVLKSREDEEERERFLNNMQRIYATMYERNPK